MYVCINLFYRHVFVEKRRFVDDKDVIKEVDEVYKQTKERCKVVKFFAVHKPMSNNTYFIIFECVESIESKVSKRLNHWIGNGFKALNPYCTGDFLAHENQCYDIFMSGHIKMINGTTTLQFLSKRENYQQLAITLTNKDTEEVSIGSLDVKEISMKKNVPAQNVTSIILWLTNLSPQKALQGTLIPVVYHRNLCNI